MNWHVKLVQKGCPAKFHRVTRMLAKLAKLENCGIGKADFDSVHKAIEALSETNIEELKKLPGYTRIMWILREEFQNYTGLSLQRGLEEKGEIFQFIAHFPRIGINLRRVNIDRSCRYDGVFPDIPRCTHGTQSFTHGRKSILGKIGLQIARSVRKKLLLLQTMI